MISRENNYKMNKRMRKSRVYYKYLISFIVVFILPLCMLGFLIYTYYIDIYQQKVIDGMADSLNRIAMSVDFQIAQINEISDKIFTNTDLRNTSLESDAYSGISIIKELGKYKTANNFISEIILYDEGSDYLLSSKSSYPIGLFCKLHSFKALGEENFAETMNSITSRVVRTDENVAEHNGEITIDKRFITFIYLLSSNGYKTSRRLLVMVPDSSFMRIIGAPGEKDKWNIVVLDRDDNLVTAYSSGLSLKSAMSKVYPYANGGAEASGRPDGSTERFVKAFAKEKVTIDGTEYLSLYIKSEGSGWSYICVTEYKGALAEVTRIKYLLVISVLIIFVIGCLVILRLTKSNYMPINELGTYAQKHRDNRNVIFKNEFEVVKDTLDNLSNDLKDLKSKAWENKKAIKEYLLYRLLKGRIPSAEYLDRVGKQSGVELNKEKFKVIVLHNKAFEENESSFALIEEALPRSIRGYVKEYDELAQAVLIVSYDDISRADLYQYLEQRIQFFKNHFDSDLTIGVGEGYSDYLQIPMSFMEALNAVNYRFIAGTGRIIKFSETPNNNPSVDWRLNELPVKLSSLIKKGDIKEIEIFLENISNHMKKGNVSLFTARMFCFNIINVSLRTFNEISAEYDISLSDYPDIPLIASFQTVDELTDIIYKLSEDVCNYIGRKTENNDLTLVESIKKYIKSNYTEYDFSIQQMSDDFRMTAPNLSAYFKKQTGMTILDYTIDIKMSKAKQILASTDKPIKDVALEVGYCNLTSFLRRFKHVTGLTPSEWKKEYSS